MCHSVLTLTKHVKIVLLCFVRTLPPVRAAYLQFSGQRNACLHAAISPLNTKQHLGQYSKADLSTLLSSRSPLHTCACICPHRTGQPSQKLTLITGRSSQHLPLHMATSGSLWWGMETWYIMAKSAWKCLWASGLSRLHICPQHVWLIESIIFKW